jgi:putative sigma-54 modulation protein
MGNNTNNIKISGHHVEVTEALENHIKNMISKLQHKFVHITHVHVILKIDSSIHPHLQQAEAEVSLSGKKEPIFAKASSIDMYEALHQLKDKLDRQIVKHKEILKPHGDHTHHHNDHLHNDSDTDNCGNEN